MALSEDGYREPDALRSLASQFWSIDRGSVGRRLVLVAAMVLALGQLVGYMHDHRVYAGDFRDGIRPAGSHVLHGVSPYPPAQAGRLLVLLHAFVTPPPIALVASPFSLLPAPVAVVLWNLICALALVAALRVMGVRDSRIYLLALCSLPFLDSLENGQPDGLFALAAALAWRYRGSWRGAVWAALLIAAKLIAWPLLIWMAVTRRSRALVITIGATILILAVAWAAIGFHGLAQYPRLLEADAKAFETYRFSASLVQALSPIGLPIAATRGLAMAVALALAAAIVALARGSDEGWFGGALTLGVLCSPIVWFHYAVVLFVPLCFARRRPIRVWAASSFGCWCALLFLHTAEGRAVALTAVMVGSVAWATKRPRPVPSAQPLRVQG